MQNRLDAAKAARDSSRKSLEELQRAMQEEKTVRPETVCWPRRLLYELLLNNLYRRNAKLVSRSWIC